MGNQINKNAATDKVAALQTAYDAALEELNLLPETATDIVRQEAVKKVSDAKSVLDAEIAKENEVPAGKVKTKKVKFLVSPTGKFNLAYNEGEQASLPEPQAIELEELGYVKFVK